MFLLFMKLTNFPV